MGEKDEGANVIMWIINKKFILGTSLFLLAGQFASLHSAWVRVNMQWFDMPLHFVGGVMISSFFFAFLDGRVGLFDVKKNYLTTIIFAIFFIMLIGAFFEFYEFIVDYIHRTILNSGSTRITIEDTLSDLINDLLGGLTATAIYLRDKNKCAN